jgi:hypothetical protein
LASEAEACRAAGMDDCLVKPMELIQLQEKLERWLPIPQEGSAAAGTSALAPESATVTT